MADSESNIPTLTEITHPGNQEMLNHFDAHGFDDETEEATSTFTLKNASATENTVELKNSEHNEIPSIQIEEISPTDIEPQDFSEAMQPITDKDSTKEVNTDDLKDKIDQAITDALPGIEEHLKKQLYTRFGV